MAFASYGNAGVLRWAALPASSHGSEVHSDVTYCAIAALALAVWASQFDHRRASTCWGCRVYYFVAQRLARGSDAAAEGE
nr:unnamed protein product [Leishmania braziliensis]